MRILYITQWFDPEPNIIKGPAFVRALAAQGHDVLVLTGLPNYPTGRLYPGYRFRLFQQEMIDGVRVARLPLYPSHSLSAIGRIANFLSFFVSVLVYLLLRGHRFDLWYVYHPPITVGLAAALARIVRRRRFVLEIQDLWPDTVVVSRMTGTSRMWGILGALCRFTYARAERIVAQSRGMRDRLLERGVAADRIDVIRNWADDTALDRPDADRAGLDMPVGFTLVYAGNLGRMQALDTALRAMRLVEDRGVDATLILIGDGVERDALRKAAGDLDLRGVRFVDRMPQADVARWCAAADALLLHLARDPLFEITIPSKTQFYLASGRPIVAGIDGEAADLLSASGAALVVPAEDATALADAIIRMAALPPPALAAMGANGVDYYERTFGFAQGLALTAATLDRARGP